MSGAQTAAPIRRHRNVPTLERDKRFVYIVRFVRCHWLIGPNLFTRPKKPLWPTFIQMKTLNSFTDAKSGCILYFFYLWFEPSVTKFDWKLKEDLDFLKIKDNTDLIRRKVLKYKSQDESKKYDSVDFRCFYFNLSKTH